MFEQNESTQTTNANEKRRNQESGMATKQPPRRRDYYDKGN